MSHKFKFIFWLSYWLSLQVSASAMDLIPIRRETPAIKEFGHLIFPIVTAVPGVGTGYGGGLLVNNILGSRTSLTGVAMTGDISTAVLALTGIGDADDGISFDATVYSTRIPFQIYPRGPDSNSDIFFSQLMAESGGSLALNGNYCEQRLSFSTQFGTSRIHSVQLSDSDGDQFNNADHSTSDSISSTTTLRIDLTDNFQDPHRGLRLEALRDETSIFDGLHARFASYDTNVTAYFPIGRSHTWAFNYFRAWAATTSANNLSNPQLQKALSLNCGSITDPVIRNRCQTTENLRVNERASENQYGTATPLGAPMQMRAFPLGRFRGNQSEMYGSELRLNFGDEKSKFDYGLISGSLMTVQLAIFAEAGSAVDSPASVESSTLRTSYGLGLRLGFSGSIVRADFGVGNEGTQFTFFIGYPWGLSPF